MGETFRRRVVAIALVTLAVNLVNLWVGGGGWWVALSAVAALVGVAMAYVRPWVVGRSGRAYRVTFEPDGHDWAEPMVFKARDADELAELVYEQAHRHVTSDDIDVDGVLVDLEDMTGCFFVPVGRFTIEEVGSGGALDRTMSGDGDESAPGRTERGEGAGDGA